jgi:hypothetical protein
MISSTARDLPEHRKEVMDACLRQGMFPVMMEHLPSSDEEAIPASLRMVDEADIYLLILAHRYGYVPAEANPSGISVTEHEYNRAVDMLDDVWEAAERGPYPLFHADAFNVLIQIERDEGNSDAAIEAATKAYRLAWCDGPPFAYHWGLEKAKQHLKELGAPEPEMPPFDESKFEPMPEVEIDPDDEFHVRANGIDEPEA